jgi:hypothetical protein
MGSDRVPTGDVAAELPELSGRLQPPAPSTMPQTLAGRLVPLADRLRGLKARFGVRPYRVFLVHAVWTGGKRGVGHKQLTSRVEIIPPPRVTDLAAVNRRLRATGLNEEGDVRIDEISAKYAEDDLMGRTPDLQNPEERRTLRQDVEFWWEIHEARAVGVPPAIRRFSPPNTVPMLKRDDMQWRVTLTRQAEDRARSGATDPNES